MADFTIPDTEQFSIEFATTLVVALTTYAPALALLLEVIDHPDDPARVEGLHTVGQHIGLELLGFVRAHDLAREQLTGHRDDPAAVLPLAAILGESIAILGVVDGAESAGRVPVAPLERVAEFYTPAAQAWLARFVPELPEWNLGGDA